MKIANVFRVIFGFLLAILAVALGMSSVSYRNLINFEKASLERTSSYMLAETLWETQYNMSNHAKEYVVTGDASALAAYERERGVRLGVVAGEGGRAMSLRDRFVEAGFTEEELRLTDRAERALDSIERGVERRAFAALEGLYDDGSGRYTRAGEPDTLLARRLLFSDAYKAMCENAFARPLQDAEDKILERLEGVLAAKRKSAYDMGIVLVVFVVAGALMVFVGIVMVRRLVLRPLGGEPRAMRNLAQSIAQGRLQRYEAEGLSDGNVSGALAIMSNRLVEVVESVQELSGTLETYGEKLSATSESLAEGSNKQANSTEEMSSTIEEEVATLHASVDNAQEARALALSSMELVEANLEAAREALDSSEEISVAVRQIREIASKTNILALNAAVEAARAGDSGRGFAVVAGEVRKLADLSSGIASKIVEMAERCTGATKRSVEQSQSVTVSMKRNAELIDEVSTSQQELTKGADGTNVAAQQLSEVAQRTASVSEELAGFSNEMREYLGRLQKSVGFFTGV